MSGGPGVWARLAALLVALGGAGAISVGASAPSLHLDLSTYVGGSRYDVMRDIATDAVGNVYLTGGTDSPDFPTTPGVLGPTHHGSTDAFVMKLDPAGRVLWSTFVGGPSMDRAYAIEVDASGHVYIAGRAGAGFPVTALAVQTEFRGGPPGGPYPSQSGFVAKLSPDGRRLVFATYFGAGDDPAHPIRDLALDTRGDIYIAASSSTGAYPAVVLAAFRTGFQPRRAGKQDIVVAKLASDGSRVLWATYLGGADVEEGVPSVRVDAAGRATVMINTASSDMPTTAGAFSRTYRGNGDFWVGRLSPDGSSLVFGTYLGGSGREDMETHTLALDGEGNAIVAAGTLSPDFPVTPGTFQTRFGGPGGRGTGLNTNYAGDAVVAKVAADGKSLLASTFVGGRFGESAEGVGLDRDGNVHVTGATFSDDFPVSPDAFQARRRGTSDVFVVKLSADLRRLLYGTLVGGSGGGAGRALAVDTLGRVYAGGEITFPDWPLRNALQRRPGGGVDAALVRFTPGPEGRP